MIRDHWKEKRKKKPRTKASIQWIKEMLLIFSHPGTNLTKLK